MGGILEAAPPLAADPVTPDTPLHDAEEWWDPKSRLRREEVDLVIKNASAGEMRATVLLLGAFAMVGLPVVLGGVLLLAAGSLGLSAIIVVVNGPIRFPDGCPEPLLPHHPPRNFPLRVLSELQDCAHPCGQVGARKPGGAMKSTT